MSGTTTRTEHKPVNTDRTAQVDRSRSVERYRWVCPNGHVDWDRTNSHGWCRACQRATEAGEDLDPEHYELFDKKAGELVPYENVEIVGDR